MKFYFWLIICICVAMEAVPKELQATKSEYLDKMKCGDCANVNEDCNITFSGFYCPSESDKLRIENKTKLNHMVKHLSSCLPEEYEFSQRKEIQRWCTFWTPQMKCQMVKNINNRENCSQEAVCPCNVDYEERKRKWRKRRRRRRSGQQKLGSSSSFFLLFRICAWLLLFFI